MTTTGRTTNRFEVLCEVCGFVSDHRTRADAFWTGKRHHETGCADQVQVYDVMARQGQPELWAIPGGAVVANRMTDEEQALSDELVGLF